MLLVLVSGCATAVIVPTSADVAAADAVFPGATLAELQRGRDAFVARCAGCHQLPAPSRVAPAEWPRLVDRMAPDARISDEEKSLIARYLVAASARSHRAPASVDGALAASR